MTVCIIHKSMNTPAVKADKQVPADMDSTVALADTAVSDCTDSMAALAGMAGAVV